MTDLYPVVVTDPPWLYSGSGTKMAAAAKHYDCLSKEALVDVARPPLTSRGILFCWTTSAKLEEALWLFSQWGLTYRGVAFVWVKTRKDGMVIGAQGVKPSITKPTTEFVLAASQIKTGRPLPIADNAVPQVILAPRREHSRKPDEIFARIDRLYPNLPKLEMFSRETRPGWDNWGNETAKFNTTTP